MMTPDRKPHGWKTQPRLADLAGFVEEKALSVDAVFFAFGAGTCGGGEGGATTDFSGTLFSAGGSGASFGW